MGKLDLITTIRHLHNATGFNNQTAFYLHDGQYINSIKENEKGLGYIVFYSNGNQTVVNGDEKVTVQKT